MAGVRQFNEQEVFERAIALFWRKGYAETSMQDLADATGVQRGSLYNAYGGKEQLFLRAYQVHTEGYLAKARQALSRSTLRSSMSSFFDFIVDWLLEGEPSRGCLSTKTVFGGEVVEAPIREAVSRLLDGLEAAVRDRLSQPDKTSKLALPPAKAARLVITVTRGIVVLQRIYPDDRQRLRAAADSLLETLFA
jgi:TetR/AcrR family transcriptional regulator, transcriptional repressor for nem operon